VRYGELLRHPDKGGGTLSPDGVAAAEVIGRTRLRAP
jgi:hypothetical protein